MKKHQRNNKGKIIWDEGADHRFKPYVRKAQWEVSTMSKADIGVGLKDPKMLKKYTKGSFAIFTSDHTSYTENPISEGAIGFVVHDSPSREEFDEYCNRIYSFFKERTASDLKGKIVKIKKKGQITVKKIR